ncbi:unnamed protein product [Enterobius vermicularis]|uniref:CaMBD domain-containing protein n=1 Tax=Enterobius vermicularis TaxID=51028 RepID=A0A0N4VN68_ENTVE|nr:unnamed protein product [Enterobius vermicularis]
MVDCGADDWRVVITWHRVIQFFTEIALCSVCPLPYTGKQSWTFMENTRVSNKIHHKDVPVDVILSLLMIGRVYLVGRYMVLHSKQFQDASTRTLAALNRIQVNFSFVMKSMLQQHPLSFITAFTLVFWVVTAWTFVQEEETVLLYSNAMWFIAITFMLNGYGDIVPYTHVGRIIAIIGAIVSSIMIAVISKKILLSQGQNNVNNFMEDSRLTRAHEDAAARVLQHTWHIHKCWTSGDNDNGHLRRYQRKFLRAIH